MPDVNDLSGSPVTLVPMTATQFAAWHAQTVREYAAGHVEAGNWPAEESIERAEATIQRLLPAGTETPGHHLWSLRGPDGEHAGILWVGPREPPLPGALYIWDIAVDPAHRGRGYGRAALEALDAWARSHGYDRIGLHVFGSNGTARRLYQRAGYVETDVLMEKRL